MHRAWFELVTPQRADMRQALRGLVGFGEMWLNRIPRPPAPDAASPGAIAWLRAGAARLVKLRGLRARPRPDAGSD
jgi:hypothetical protein